MEALLVLLLIGILTLAEVLCRFVSWINGKGWR